MHHHFLAAKSIESMTYSEKALLKEVVDLSVALVYQKKRNSSLISGTDTYPAKVSRYSMPR